MNGNGDRKGEKFTANDDVNNGKCKDMENGEHKKHN
jgi:hypothetical protein